MATSNPDTLRKLATQVARSEPARRFKAQSTPARQVQFRPTPPTLPTQASDRARQALAARPAQVVDVAPARPMMMPPARMASMMRREVPIPTTYRVPARWAGDGTGTGLVTPTNPANDVFMQFLMRLLGRGN